MPGQNTINPDARLRILGNGHYLPEKVLTNQDIEQLCETSHEWIVERTGIERRHVCADGEGNADIATEASKRALAAAGMQADELDMILVATCSQDYNAPSVACWVQQKLGLRPLPVFDINAACSGFIYLLEIAQVYLNTNPQLKILICGSERLSQFIHWDDRSTAVLFGDGCGAAVVTGGAAENSGLFSTHIYADGSKAGILGVCNANPPYHPPELAGHIYMDGQAVFKSAVLAFSSSIDECLEHNGVDKSEIDWFIPHQANIRIINAVGKRLGMADDKIIVTVNECANTSAASIPTALSIAVDDGRIKRGDLVLMAGFGAGLTWGAALLRY